MLLERSGTPSRGLTDCFGDFYFPELQATYDDLMRGIASNGGADLLVSGEHVYPASLVVEKTGIRWASYTTSPFAFFSAYDPPILPAFPKIALFLRSLGPSVNKLTIGLVKRIARTWCAPVRQLRTKLGLRPGRDPVFEDRHSPQLVLAIFSPELADPQPD